MNEPITETDLARVAELDAQRKGGNAATCLLANYTLAEICPRLARELAAARGAIKVAREALGASRITMSITPATDTMPGYLPELYKSQIKPTLEKVDAALAQLNTHTHE